MSAVKKKKENEGLTEEVPMMDMPISYTVEVDATGLQCPGPLMQTFTTVEKMKDGQVVLIKASDFGFANDISAWCDKTGNTLLNVTSTKNLVQAYVLKGTTKNDHNQVVTAEKKDATIVLFSGDYDKALAAMIIAIGSASLGHKVSMFCTFWGLNALKKEIQDTKVEKTLVENMFSKMLPKNAEKMPLSSMNMFGAGKSMMTKVMKDKNVASLSELMQQARDLNVKFIACTMSMDVLGISKEELRDDVTYGGVGSYVADSENAALTLFI